MITKKILAILTAVCFLLSVILELIGEYITAVYFDVLVVPLITITYMLLVKNKDTLFLLFLIVFSLGDISGFIGFFLRLSRYETALDLFFLCDILYIMAYAILLIKIALSLSIKHVVKHLKMHAIVMTLLCIYLLYLLQTLVIGSSITSNMITIQKEFVYNAVTLALLTISFLNYMYKDNRQALYLFLGVLALVFCEVFEIAYIYINNSNDSYNHVILISIAKVLSLGAFYLLYQQSKLIKQIN